jgi:hypothetical protein
MSKDDLTKQSSTWPAAASEFLKSPKAGWILFAITIFLLLFIIVARLAGLDAIGTVIRTIPDNNQGQKNEKDPLDIEGTWTYTTFFDNDPEEHKYKRVQGVNLLIKFDGCGYTMQGKRTDFMEKNSNDFTKYPTPIPIKITRTSFTPELTNFYFYFEVQSTDKADQSEGFVELQIDKSSKSKMVGVVHYLHNNGRWSKAPIIFEKQ